MKALNTFILTIAILASSLMLHAQDNAKEGTETWKTLSKITFRKQYDEFMGFKVDVPVFSPDVKELEGKEVIVRGYIIPTEGYKSHTEFVFSAYPYNMCFFCGGAGPETVMEVQAAEPIKYSADPVIIKGTIHLNLEGDIERLIYSLSDAKLVRE